MCWHDRLCFSCHLHPDTRKTAATRERSPPGRARHRADHPASEPPARDVRSPRAKGRETGEPDGTHPGLRGGPRRRRVRRDTYTRPSAPKHSLKGRQIIGQWATTDTQSPPLTSCNP